MPGNLVYDVTLYILAVLLLGGLVCNFLVKPVDSRHQMSDEELQRERALAHEVNADPRAATAAQGGAGALVLLAWLAVGIPFAWGLWTAILKAAPLFR